jgi:hypothetical protein
MFVENVVQKDKTTLKFDDFYAGQLENLITQYKEKLDTVS